MDDIEQKFEEHALRSNFPPNTVGRALADEAVALWKSAMTESGRERAYRAAHLAASYANVCFSSNAFSREGNLSEWFSLPDIGIAELACRQQRRIDRFRSLTDEELERLEEEEDERERQDRLEEEGAYGRTLPWTSECDGWIFVRFGKMPLHGKSVFGLAREDNEDGPDPWRQELGGMTHEAGVSVFRAYRHPDVPDALVLMQPHFDLARYGVSSQREHLLSVIPRKGDGEVEAFRIDGFLATCRGFDKSVRLELGSDGEYLVDARRPYSAIRLQLDSIWVSEWMRLDDLLNEARFCEFDAGPLPSSPSP